MTVYSNIDNLPVTISEPKRDIDQTERLQENLNSYPLHVMTLAVSDLVDAENARQERQHVFK